MCLKIPCSFNVTKVRVTLCVQFYTDLSRLELWLFLDFSRSLHFARFFGRSIGEEVPDGSAAE
jgi:hypothetical protein